MIVRNDGLRSLGGPSLEGRASHATWKRVALGEVVELRYGKSLPASTRVEGQVPVYGSNGQVGTHSSALTQGPAIIIGRKGSVGAIHLSSGPCWPIDTTYYVDNTATEAHLAWLAHYLNCLGLTGMNKAAAIPGLNREDVYRLPILLPPLSEQRRIAGILDAADGLRAKRRESIALLDTLTQSIFLDMFGDPTRNPNAWPTESLGNLVRVFRGASPRPAGDPRFFGGPIPWLLISDVTKDSDRLLRGTRTGVTEAGKNRSVYVRAGTLVLSNSATIGVPKVLDLDVCIHDGFLAFDGLGPELDREYLYAYFLALRPRLRVIAPEGTQKNLNTGIAKGLPVPVPPIELQRTFAGRLLEQERLACAVTSSQTQIDALFLSLQSRAFRGEL